MSSTHNTLMGQKAIVESASKELIVRVNAYANLALALGREEGNEPDKIRYAIQVIKDMQDRCDSPEETIELLEHQLKDEISPFR